LETALEILAAEQKDGLSRWFAMTVRRCAGCSSAWHCATYEVRQPGRLPGSLDPLSRTARRGRVR